MQASSGSIQIAPGLGERYFDDLIQSILHADGFALLCTTLQIHRRRSMVHSVSETGSLLPGSVLSCTVGTERTNHLRFTFKFRDAQGNNCGRSLKH